MKNLVARLEITAGITRISACISSAIGLFAISTGDRLTFFNASVATIAFTLMALVSHVAAWRLNRKQAIKDPSHPV